MTPGQGLAAPLQPTLKPLRLATGEDLAPCEVLVADRSPTSEPAPRSPITTPHPCSRGVSRLDRLSSEREEAVEPSQAGRTLDTR